MLISALTGVPIEAGDATDPVFAAIAAHTKAADALDIAHQERLAAGDPEHRPVETVAAVQAALIAQLRSEKALIDTAPTTQAGLRALEKHLRLDRHYSARGFIGVPCGHGFAHSLDGTGNQKSVDWLIAKRAAEIDNAA